jgi:DNA mismatch endonuclease (patch repair protein)
MTPRRWPGVDPTRSRTMASVKQKGTAPELLVRRLLHGLGYRYRLHCRDLPGTPDLVWRPRKKAIFIHGCFWHGHDCQHGRRQARSNREYWMTKLQKNQSRDAATADALAKMGWTVMTVWECQLKSPDSIATMLTSFLGAVTSGRSKSRKKGRWRPG